ncbi:MAG TPA: copper resistance protein CopC [Glycomyces sp.]|nr:copper resistance protein CopC [Glycomyces sp.]
MNATRGRPRAAAPAALAALAALLWMLLPAQAAQAHTSLTGSDPEEGAVLTEPPASVTLHFNEPVQPVDEVLRLVDADGADHPVEATTSDNDVIVTMGHDLPAGGYSLNWRVISADGHPVSGVLGFTLDLPEAEPSDEPTEAAPTEHETDEAPGGGAEETATDAAAETAVSEVEDHRAAVTAVSVLQYLGLLVFAGLVCFRAAIARDLCPPRPRHRLLRASGALAVLAAAAAIPIGALDLMGLPLRRVLDYGAWSGTVQTEPVAILALTAVGVGAAYWLTARGRRPWAAPASLVAAAVALAAPVLTGHSMLFEPGWAMIAADVVHLFTGAVWIGGLLGLLIVLRHALRRGAGADAVGPATVVARFSTWAGVTVALLAASGLTMAVLIHREWSSLFGSEHGRMLLVKLAIVAVAVALAAWNRFRLVPLIRGGGEGGLGRLRRILAVEALVVATAVGVTGALVHLSPQAETATAAETEAAPPPAEVALQHDLGEGTLTAVVEPGRTGANTIAVELVDAEGAPVEPLEAPVVSASLPAEDFGPIEAPTEAGADPGVYLAAIDLPMAGEWEVAVHVRVSRFEEHHAVLDLVLE